jgi:hypothetical protein
MIHHVFSVGDLVEIKWSDPQGCINDSLNELGTAQCVTRGTVLRQDGNALCLWTSRYLEDKDEGDGTTLDVRVIDEWRVLLPAAQDYDPHGVATTRRVHEKNVPQNG